MTKLGNNLMTNFGQEEKINCHAGSRFSRVGQDEFHWDQISNAIFKRIKTEVEIEEVVRHFEDKSFYLKKEWRTQPGQTGA